MPGEVVVMGDQYKQMTSEKFTNGDIIRFTLHNKQRWGIFVDYGRLAYIKKYNENVTYVIFLFLADHSDVIFEKDNFWDNKKCPYDPDEIVRQALYKVGYETSLDDKEFVSHARYGRNYHFLLAVSLLVASGLMWYYVDFLKSIFEVYVMYHNFILGGIFVLILPLLLIFVTHLPGENFHIKEASPTQQLTHPHKANILNTYST